MDDSLERRLKRRLTAFFDSRERDSHPKTEPIRRNAIDVLKRSTSRRWPTYVVGGAIRDLLLGPSRAWPRDVDIIVDGCSTAELVDVFGDILVRRNSFGGLHLRKTVEVREVATARYDLLFDLWRLEDTWAIKKEGMSPTIASFIRTPFLNIDSVAVVLDDQRGPMQIYEEGFFQAVSTKTLEINNERNPFPLVCAVRSLILAAKLDFWIGPRLSLFIREATESTSTHQFQKIQLAHYGQIRCGNEVIEKWLASVRSQLDDGLNSVRLSSSPSLQLKLWPEGPPILEKTMPRVGPVGQP